MILILNKKHGVGCTTISYTLGRLFDLPIYVQADSFLLDDDDFDIEYRKKCKVFPIDTDMKNGIVDVGSDLSNIEDFIDKAKAIIIPIAYDYETTLRSIDTIKLIRDIDKDIQIILIVNRLDRADELIDFEFSMKLMDSLYDANIGVNDEHKFNVDIQNPPSLVVTYLRNSYSIFENIHEGDFFLNSIESSKLKNSEYDLNKYNEILSNEKYDLFLYLVYLSFKNKNYKDDKIYHQNKDFVMFRIKFLDDCESGELKPIIEKYEAENFTYFRIKNGVEEKYTAKYKYNTQVFNKSKKLIKDLAYITYYVSKYID